MSKYEPGDVVRLKSGGPLMTVRAKFPPGVVVRATDVQCVWFGADGVLREGEFEEACLAPAPQPAAS